MASQLRMKKLRRPPRVLTLTLATLLGRSSHHRQVRGVSAVQPTSCLVIGKASTALARGEQELFLWITEAPIRR